VRCLDQRADRAHQRALATGDAAGFAQGFVEHRHRQAVEATFGETDHMLLLARLAAGLHTKGTFDAFRQVPPDARRGVVAGEVFGVFRRACRDLRPALLPLVLCDEGLEPAIAIHLAAHAIIRVAGKNPLGIGPAKGAQVGAVGVDDITALRWGLAGRLGSVLAFNLHKAHPAHAVRRQAGMMAERRHMAARCAHGVEQRGAFLDLDRPPVHAQLVHRLSFPSGLEAGTLCIGTGPSLTCDKPERKISQEQGTATGLGARMTHP